MSLQYLQAPYETTAMLKRDLLAQISSAQLNQEERNRQRSVPKLIVGLPEVKLLMKEDVKVTTEKVISITVGKWTCVDG